MNDPIAEFLGSWATELTVGSILLRIALSLLFSSIIGCERSGKRHAAGLRTFMIVWLGGTSATLFDFYLIANAVVGFPLLSAAGVVAVSVIAANSLLYSSKNQIKGLTTSVGLWACGILGLAIGAGLYTITLVAFFALICSLSLFPHVEGYLKNRSNHFEVHLELKNIAYLQNFVATIRELGLTIDDIEANTAYQNSGLAVYYLAVTITGKELRKYKTHDEIISALGSLEYVNHIEEI